MEPLKPRRVEYYALRYTELECYFKKVYGHEYEIPPGEEFGPGSLEEDIESEPLDEYDTKQLNKFKKTGEGNFLLRILMTDCCNMGLLPAGKYIIDVTW